MYDARGVPEIWSFPPGIDSSRWPAVSWPATSTRLCAPPALTTLTVPGGLVQYRVAQQIRSAKLDALSGPDLPLRPVNHAVEPVGRCDLADLSEPRECERS